MDREQAEAEAGRRNAEDADRDRFQWHAVAKGGDAWVLIKSPRGSRVDPLTATTEAAPRPAHPEAPSMGPLGDLPGYR